MMKRVTLLVLLTLLCSLSVAAQEQHGTVYLFRGRDTANYPPEGSVSNPEAIVYLDGKEFLSMPEQTFVGFRMPAGQYVLTMKKKGVRKVLDIEPDKIYYLRVSQVVYPNAYQIFYVVEERTALEAMRKCDAIREKKVKLKLFEMIRTNPNKKDKS